jgi:hypothetical protein
VRQMLGSHITPRVVDHHLGLRSDHLGTNGDFLPQAYVSTSSVRLRSLILQRDLESGVPLERDGATANTRRPFLTMETA